MNVMNVYQGFIRQTLDSIQICLLQIRENTVDAIYRQRSALMRSDYMYGGA